jgi:hypothetical protein
MQAVVLEFVVEDPEGSGEEEESEEAREAIEKFAFHCQL